jgi:hypothetical protein
VTIGADGSAEDVLTLSEDGGFAEDIIRVLTFYEFIQFDFLPRFHCINVYHLTPL